MGQVIDFYTGMRLPEPEEARYWSNVLFLLAYDLTSGKEYAKV